MKPQPAEFTVSAAAALADVDENRVWKDREHGIFPDRDPIRLELADVLYLAVVNSLSITLDVNGRRRLREALGDALNEQPIPKRVDLDDVVSITIDKTFADLRRRVDAFEDWCEKKLVADPKVMAGEPVFRSSRVTVRRIGDAVVQGVSERELLEDFPELSAADLAHAALYVRAYPARGRPRR